MAWARRREAIAPSQPALVPNPLRDLLQYIDAESIILDAGGHAVHISSGISTFNILRDESLVNRDLMNMVRAVERSNVAQEANLELRRGPIGAGMHDVFVRVAPLGEDLIAILIFDDSEMRRLDAIRRDFVANISHELKTPIGALSILSEAVLGAADDPEAITRFATRMQTEAKRLSDLVQEIIDLSRLQDNDPLRNGESFTVAEVVQDGIDLSQLATEAKHISIVFKAECNPKIVGDKKQLIMAVGNLVENAVNYSPERTRISVVVKSTDGICEISVSDQGIGIPEKDLERIFERFYRVDAARSRSTGGTGLGLSIVKHIAINHGGEVSVWSVEGAGSTFTIRLPEAK